MGLAKYIEDIKEIFNDNLYLRQQGVKVKIIREVPCPYCQKKFDNLNDVWDHIMKAHSQGEENIFVDIQSSRLIFYNINSFYSSYIDAYVDKWNKLLNKGKSIGIMEKHHNLDAITNKYLDGIYNYFVACENKGKKQENLLYETRSILKCFDKLDRRGAFILEIIAYKYNWLGELGDLCKNYPNDIFSLLSDFYNGNWHGFDTCSQNSGNCIYIENEEEKYLDMVVQFMNNNLEPVRQYLSSLSMENVDDINLKDRILFLEACVARKDKDWKHLRMMRDDICSEELKKKLERIFDYE